MNLHPSLPVCLLLALASLHALAESPLTRYKRNELALLEKNCKRESLIEAAIKDAPALSSGLTWAPNKLSERKGVLLNVEVLRNRAMTYKWEVLNTEAPRVKMALSLPRDLGSCALVTLPDGRQRLEVVVSTLLIQGDARDLWRRAASRAQNPEGCRYVYPDFKVTTQGESAYVPACTPSDALWATETLRWIRRAELK